MPYIAVRTTSPVSAETSDRLQQKVVEIVSLIPGKNMNNCMVEIISDCTMFMGGKPSKTVMCEIKMFGFTTKEIKEQVIKQLNDLFTEMLGAEMVYTGIQESPEFGVGPNLKCI